MVDPAPFSFGFPDFFMTALSVVIIFAIIGPRYLKQRREKQMAAGEE